MRHLIALVAATGLMTATEVLANAPEQSLRPAPRPGAAAAQETPVRTVAVPVYYNADTRPPPRPGAVSTSLENTDPTNITPAETTPATATRVAATTPGVVRSLRPPQRPNYIRQIATESSQETVATTQTRTAAAEPRTETRRERRRREREERRAARRAQREQNNLPAAGSVCNSRSIRGERVQRVSGRINGCGISNPVRITEVAGVTLNTPPTINCDTAQALERWINEGVKPAVGRIGGGVQSMRVVAGYSCRTRNNRAGARLSEHAKGNAIDISSITLNNGRVLDVLTGWRRGAEGQLLRQLHQSACGPFGTVLGPNSDRYHQDHFHFDVARHRGGAYCR